ncbi:MAG: hypothetical protein SWZ49_00675, partial [Cyanobacteriota bacterium]|nr:hypothetical protein [Cyanobacteriota bacterium]
KSLIKNIKNNWLSLGIKGSLPQYPFAGIENRKFIRPSTEKFPVSGGIKTVGGIEAITLRSNVFFSRIATCKL